MLLQKVNHALQTKLKKNGFLGTSLMVQWLRIRLPMQGTRVQSLVGELRSHMPRGQKSQNIEQKQYGNKFNKGFKNGPHHRNLKNN